MNVPRGTKNKCTITIMKNGIPGKDYIGVAAGILIFNEKQELLIMRRSQQTRNEQGKWSIPGGKIEYGESVEESIKRETQEECGIIVDVVSTIGYVDHFIPDSQPHLNDKQHWVSVMFFAKEWAGIPIIGEPEKCDGLDWCTLDQIPEYSSIVVFKAIELFKSSLFHVEHK